MENIQREQPTQRLSVKQEEGKVYSVSTEKFPYMATDGYNCIVTRQMDINEHKLAELVAGIEKDIESYPTDIQKATDVVKEMTEELDKIKALEHWNLVKDNWEQFSEIFGGIQKESKLFQKENELKNLELTREKDIEVLANYKQVLELMTYKQGLE